MTKKGLFLPQELEEFSHCVAEAFQKNVIEKCYLCSLKLISNTDPVCQRD